MLDHDRKLSGLEDQGIFSAGKFVGREGVIQFQAGGKVYRADTIDKSKFEQKRSLLNSNTLQQNLVKKDPRLVKELKMMNLHMELRYGLKIALFKLLFDIFIILGNMPSSLGSVFKN